MPVQRQDDLEEQLEQTYRQAQIFRQAQILLKAML
jgi:hypothetical protein